MPFDGSTYRRNDPESIREAFMAWAKSQPPRKLYNYFSAKNCAFSRFLKETGRSTLTRPTDGVLWWDGAGSMHFIPKEISELLPPLFVIGSFGSLVRRLEKYYAEQNIFGYRVRTCG